MNQSRVVIVGCGYVGRRVAAAYLERGASVLGIVASKRSADALAASQIPAVPRDLASDELGDLPFADVRLFHFAPPPARGLEDQCTRRLVSAFERAGQPARLVYISTTGVYGDCQGAWVDESWPPQPAADRARRRWDAEQTLRQWARATGGQLVILRVPGIYGPDRLPLERLRRRLPMVREADAPYSNRIHVEDLVAACVAAMEGSNATGIYNVSDGHPTTMTDYFQRVADAAGLPRPPLISLQEADGQLSTGMLSYMQESRRLTNRRLVEELGVSLRYPTLDEGLKASLSQRE
jgi:nucleoside-diphosphate-sugar epimerase